MIRRPPRSTQSRSSAASDVYKRQGMTKIASIPALARVDEPFWTTALDAAPDGGEALYLSLIHISEPTRLLSISYAVFCLKKKIQITHTCKSTYTSTLHTPSISNDNIYQHQCTYQP